MNLIEDLERVAEALGDAVILEPAAGVPAGELPAGGYLHARETLGERRKADVGVVVLMP